MVDGFAVELGEFFEQLALARGQAARGFHYNFYQLIAASGGRDLTSRHEIESGRNRRTRRGEWPGAIPDCGQRLSLAA